MVSADNIKKELKVAALSINLHQPDIPNIPITDKVTIKALSMYPKNVLNEIPATINITNREQRLESLQAQYNELIDHYKQILDRIAVS